ncbi:MAG: hypothetical protein ABFR89_11450 [Actinomycetota bacterium]
MTKRLFLVVLLVFSIVASACSSEPKTCDDIADVTVDHMQDLINDVEKELGDMTVEELIATGGDLPSIERFQEEATKIDERAAELSCTQPEIEAGVAARINRLEAETPIGRFIIEAIRTGGL